VSRRNGLALALAGGFAALGVLVAAGALTAIDQWAVDHTMKDISPESTAPSLIEAIIPLRHAHWHGVDVAANIVTLPAQALVSSLLVGLCCVVLERRGRRRAALVWAGAWIVGNLVEVLSKSTLSRPLLHTHGGPILGFQSSWPSGHTLRAVLLAATVAVVWPPMRRWVVAWAAATLVLLEVAGFHVPSDILGGVLLAALLIVLARDASSSPSRPPRPSSSSPSCSSATPPSPMSRRPS
jgi:membrane-associated phospholipid phosphatase